MTKKIISAGAFVLIILALGAVLYILNTNPVEEDEGPPIYSSAEVLYVIGQPEAKRVKSMSVENANGGYSINVGNPDAEKTVDITYSIAGLEGIEGDTAALSGVVSTSAKLIGSSVVSEDSSSLATYGLDKPSAVVKAQYTDGTSGELFIGNSAPAGAGVYVKSNQSEKVYLVSNSSVEKFLYRPYDFFYKEITPGNPEAEIILAATLAGTVREEPIIINIAPDKKESEVFMLTTHKITRPVQVDMDIEKGLASLASAFGMVADSVAGSASTDAEKEKFGLLEPYSVLTIENRPAEGTEKIKFTLSASEPGADGMVNLMSDSGKLVYKVAAKDVLWLESQVFNLMSKQVILPHINSVKTVTVKTQTGSTAFNVEGEDDNMKVTAEGKTLDNDGFRKFYQSLLSARYDSLPEEPVPANAPFFMSYTYEYKDGSAPDVITFRQGPARKLYIDLNGGEVFCMPSSYADKVLQDIPKILDGKPVTSYL